MARALRGQLVKLAGPGGSLFERAFREDPLDISGLALQQLRSLQGPFSIRVEDGHFLDPAGERAVLLVDPVASTMEMGPDAPLIAELEAQLGTCPLPARYLGGHRIAAESARSIRDDVQRAATLGMVALLALFLLGFRSLRPLAGAALVLAFASVATLAAGAIVGPVHGINLGFSAALLGVAVDYWIHLYVATQARQPAPGFRARLAAAQEAWAELLPSLAMGAASTLAAFLVLLLSRYPVVRNLGAMGVAATGGAFVGSWLFGPLACALVGGRPLPRFRAFGLPRWARGVLALAVVVGLVLCARSRFDGDPRHLLPPAPETQALEQELTSRYGGFGTGGMAVLQGPALDPLLERAGAVQDALTALPGVSASGTSALLPGPTLRAERRAALPGTAELQARIEAAAVELGFTPGAFAGAAQRLAAPPPAPLTPATWEGGAVEDLVHRHVQPVGGGWSVMVSLVMGSEEQAEAVDAAVHAAAPEADLVIPSRFAAEGVREILSELTRLGGLALGAILALLVARYRRPRQVFAAFLPCLSAMALAGGAFVLAGVPWNAVSAASMVLILGLGLDYGVFMLEGTRRAGVAHTGFAVLLSALTTILGFGVLVVARSPALFGVGLAVLVGMGGAALTALALVPPIARGERLVPPWVARWGARLVWLALLGLTLDVLLVQRFTLTPPRAAEGPRCAVEEPTPGDRRCGQDRLLRAEGIWSAHLSGPAWQRGFSAGALSADLDRALEEELLATFTRAVPSAAGRYAILRGVMLGLPHLDRHLRPEVLQEIGGFVAATGEHHAFVLPGYTRRVYYHAVHDIGQALVDSPLVQAACTGFMAGPPATADGHWLLARDFDFDGGRLFDQDKIVSFVVPEHGIPFASVSFAGFSGVLSGMNTHGLALAIQAGAAAPPHAPGTPMSFIAREILEHAESLDEAEAILRVRERFVGENVLVVDGRAGEAALFEVTPTRVERLPVAGSLGVSNHFRAPAFAADPVNLERMAEGTTVPRLARMEELLRRHEGQLDMPTAVAILQDRRGVGDTPLPRGHRHALDADIATHSVVFDATDRVLWVSRGPNTAGGYAGWSLDEALAGQIEPHEVIPAGDVAATLAVHRARLLLREAEGAEPAEAERLAGEALALVPGHPQALQAQAAALAAQGRREEAALVAREALAVPPEHAHQVRALAALLEGM
ncbi:MAG: C45 family autoproteolytic acyltransferase/hydrolase [Pseudomonadota bacterium]